MSSKPDVIVVGGGVGGLSAACALARKGFSVRVLERAREFGEVGAGKLGVLPENMVMKDGLHSVARRLLADDAPVNLAYVAYRGAVPIERVRENGISELDAAHPPLQ